jgi:hypothetical protein
MLQWLVGPLVDLGKQWLANKGEKQKAKHEAELKAITNDGNWEEIQARNSGTSWKDEFWTVVLSIPLICIGYAIAMDDMDVVTRVHEAFATLNTLPEWYRYLLFVAVCASFGIKSVNSLMQMNKK